MKINLETIGRVDDTPPYVRALLAETRRLHRQASGLRKIARQLDQKASQIERRVSGGSGVTRTSKVVDMHACPRCGAVVRYQRMHDRYCRVRAS